MVAVTWELVVLDHIIKVSIYLLAVSFGKAYEELDSTPKCCFIGDHFTPEAWHLYDLIRGVLGNTWSSMVTSEFVFGTDVS